MMTRFPDDLFEVFSLGIDSAGYRHAQETSPFLHTTIATFWDLVGQQHFAKGAGNGGMAKRLKQAIQNWQKAHPQ